LQHRGDRHRLSCLPWQQSATLSEAGLAFFLVAFFVDTVIIAAAAAAHAIAVAIAIAIAIAVVVAVAAAFTTALPPPPLLPSPSPLLSPLPSLPKWDICLFRRRHH
jgi:hypothetical protein